MRNPPPIVPGMPERNSSPAIPAFGRGQRNVEVERPGAGHDLALVDGEAGKATAEPDRDTGNPAVAHQ